MIKKVLKILLVLLVLASYPILVLIWHPWQMEKDLSMQEVPVASSDLYYRHLIEKDDLEVMMIPKGFIKEGMITRQEELIGKVVSSDILVAKGSVFVETMVSDTKDINDQSSVMLKKDQAAFSMNADLIQVAGNTLTVNQKVDLYCIIQNRNESPEVDLLISSVRIIDLRDRRGMTLDHPEGTGVASVIILAVDQRMIPLLTIAMELGSIQLYVTDQSWNEEKECILNEQSRILPYLVAASE